MTRTDRASLTSRLLTDADLAARTGDDEERAHLLEEVVILNMGVANAVATRYMKRGISLDDLKQVAYVALVKAARGFDAHCGHEFLSYAVPTIRGEIKRHFRDQGWTVRPPRRIQELQIRIATADNELCEHLDVDLDDVIEALSADGCFTPTSLDRPVGVDGDATVGDMLGETDRGRDAAEARVVLRPVVRRLTDRQRRILMLRYFRGWTQQEIAEDIGVTQMQVSRLLSQIMTELRDQLEESDED
jgi:RNA polymerase sigma-B factor